MFWRAVHYSSCLLKLKQPLFVARLVITADNVSVRGLHPKMEISALSWCTGNNKDVTTKESGLPTGPLWRDQRFKKA